MPQKMPVVRQFAWASVPPQLIAIAILAMAIHLIWPKADPLQSIFFGAVAYLVYSKVARRFLAKDQLAGMRAYHACDFRPAILRFQASYDFFTAHPWLDRWRYFFLGTSSLNSYRAIALCNIAFCHSQLGEGLQSKQGYERVLREFPGCSLAQMSLTMLHAAATIPRSNPAG